MKLPLTVCLIWALGSCVAGSSLFAVVDNVLGDLTGSVKETTSNTAHAGCQVFADEVEEHPIKEPYIEKISFILRTPCGQAEYPVLEAGNLPKSPLFDASKKTVVFVTGWLVDTDMQYIADMAKAHHCRGDNNFVVVNTGGFITNLYVNSAYHTGKLGEFVAIGLKNLDIPTEMIHLVGHSLGAQIVGSAGRNFYALTGEKLRRITGLDPARPCFVTPIVFPRLGWDDANFVDIIHTNPTDLGLEEAIGHVDFYPGGLEVFQPGCSKLDLLCSHERAIQYYLESVYPGNENSFMAANCSKYSDMKAKSCSGPRSPMGHATDMSLRGIHYLSVWSKSPYGKNATVDATFRTGNCGLCPN